MKKKHKRALGYMALGILISTIVFVIYNYVNSLKKEITGITASNRLTGNVQGIVSSQSPVAVVHQTGKYFLGKRIINLTNESINNVYRLTNVPKGTSYCIIHLIECEVEYNSDGDFTNGSPIANAQITIDSGPLIEVFNMKITSAIMPNAKIYVEYYQ